MYTEILTCGINRWTKNWGDPLLLGSAITALFAVAAALSIILALKAKGRERLFWIAVALAAMLFGANVHLDLHVLTTAIGRCAAQSQGWYDQREVVRGAFLAGVIVSVGVSALALVWLFRVQIIANPVILVGLGATTVMQALKAVGWNGLDCLGGLTFGPVRALDAPDVMCAILVTIGALWAMWRLRKAERARYQS